MSARRTLSEVYRWPAAIALASLVGLSSALFADGFWDAVSWIALAVPVAVGCWKWFNAGPGSA